MGIEITPIKLEPEYAVDYQHGTRIHGNTLRYLVISKLIRTSSESLTGHVYVYEELVQNEIIMLIPYDEGTFHYCDFNLQDLKNAHAAAVGICKNCIDIAETRYKKWWIKQCKK